MVDNFLKHPIFIFADDIKDICSPLHSLNITYFCHVFIDKDKKFTAIANNPAFAELILPRFNGESEKQL